MKKLLFLGWVMIFVLAASTGWAASVTFARVQANVATPTLAELRIQTWAPAGQTCTIDNRIIDFNAGQIGTPFPGRASYPPLPGEPDDGWISKDENVGFDAICIGPRTSRLWIRSGQLSNGSVPIPYSASYTPVPGGATILLKYYGCTVSKDTESSKKEFVHQATDQEIDKLSDAPAGVYGHVYHIYNWLVIPANTVPGNYSTTNYVVSFY